MSEEPTYILGDLESEIDSYENTDNPIRDQEQSGNENMETFNQQVGDESVATRADLKVVLTLAAENRSDIRDMNKRLLEARDDMKSMKFYVDQKNDEVRQDVNSLEGRVRRLEVEHSLGKRFFRPARKADNTLSGKGTRRNPPGCSSVRTGPYGREGAAGVVRRLECRFCGKMLAKGYLSRHQKWHCKG